VFLVGQLSLLRFALGGDTVVSSEPILAGLLVIAILVIAYLLVARRKTGPQLEESVIDPRLATALTSLPGIQQDLGSLKATVHTLPSNDVLQAIQQRLANLELIQQDLGALKSNVRVLPSNDVVEGIQRSLTNLGTIQQDLGALKTSVSELPSNDVLTEIQNRLTVLEGRVPNTLSTDLASIDTKLTTISSDPKVSEVHDATRKLITLLAGGKGRGSAGEFIVGEALKVLPPTMLERDFKVGGKTVEFALVLPNSKRLPLDSKWAAADLLEKLEKETDLAIEQKLIAEIERTVLSKAAEVAKYRNPAVTTDIGIAAVPDAVYRACRKAHSQAYEEYSVLVVPYSMVAPYVLALYNIHLKYGQAIELSNLQQYLSVIEQEAKNIDTDLENRVKEAGTRVNNAYESIKNALARIRAAAEYLKRAPQAQRTNPDANSENPNGDGLLLGQKEPLSHDASGTPYL
jgi:DNA anti-recombination protein RmuC